MCDLIITDTAVLFPDGTIRDGQTVEVRRRYHAGVKNG